MTSFVLVALLFYWTFVKTVDSQACVTVPVFASTVTTYSIVDTTGTSVAVATVTFTDDDTPALSMSTTQSTYFDFTDNGDKTGDVTTSGTSSILDLSGTDVTLNFTALDACGNTASGEFIVSVLNDPPTLSNLAAAGSIAEDVPTEVSITSYTCTDASDDVTASISSISPSNSPDQEFFFTRFESGSSTSAVYGIFARSQSDAAMGTFNYNTQRDYTLTIRCTDGKDPVTDTIIMNLQQNQPPEITNLPSPTSINVSQTVQNGDIVFTAVFDDPENDTVSFSFVCDPTGCPFDILDSGAIQATSDIDTISTTSYDMTVTVSDARNSGTARKLTIVITAGMSFTNLPDIIDVDENTANPTTLFVVSYTGVDGTATLSSSFSTLFAINSTTGAVSTISDINYEALSSYTYPLDITLSDGRADINDTLTINIIDVNEALTWNSALYRTNMDEGAAVGTNVTDPGFAITDPDINDTYTCTMDCATQNGYFSMSSACVVSVTSVYSLDAGLATTVNCTVTAVDGGLHTATTTFIIDVVDADNYTPTFDTSSYTYTVSAYVSVNTQVGNVTATDADAGTFGEFTYSLDQTSLPGNYFQIDGSLGSITTQVDMPTVCACSQTTFAPLAYATDKGGLVGTSTVYITVGEYTTTVTTTTTARYLTFFDDGRNVAWFAFAMALLLATAAVTAFVVIYYVLTGPSMCPNLLNPGRYAHKPDRMDPHYRDARDAASHGDTDDSTHSVRRAPPPRNLQNWRSQRMYFH